MRKEEKFQRKILNTEVGNSQKRLTTTEIIEYFMKFSEYINVQQTHKNQEQNNVEICSSLLINLRHIQICNCK